MWQNKTIIMIATGVLAVAVATAFVSMEFTRQHRVQEQLNSLLADAYREKEQLQDSVAGLEARLAEKEQALADLADVQAIRTALVKAQSGLENLNQEFNRINKERSAFQIENVSLNTRLQNTTREYMKTMAEMNSVREEAARLARGASPDRRKIEQLNKTLEEKSKELEERKTEVETIKSDSRKLADANKALEKKVRDLESERSELASQVRGMGSEAGSREAPARKLEATIAELKKSLAEREGDIKALEEKLSRTGSQLARAEKGQGTTRTVEVADPRLTRTVEELKGTNSDLKAQLARLTDELNAERQRAARLSRKPEPVSVDARKLESMQEEMRRLSDILMRKEFEIDTAKKETIEHKEKILALQEKIAGLEAYANNTRVSKSQLNDLQSQKMLLESKLAEVQTQLSKKQELADSLQKNVDFLNQDVAKKEEARLKLESQLSSLGSSSREELEREKSRSTEMNLLYSSLKAQLQQYADAIRLKEAQIEADRRQIGKLQDETTELKFKAEKFERDLAEARERQRKVMDDLSAAVRLNAVLQERLFGGSLGTGAQAAPESQEDRRKADELKKKIEVILEPEKN
ncbi:MAG: hypothetical protein PHT59_05330 [Candidatus Omnitrophica bacterium]|nr:hypothetical protein [Candidatus Omnitrophota bacterium]